MTQESTDFLRLLDEAQAVQRNLEIRLQRCESERRELAEQLAGSMAIIAQTNRALARLTAAVRMGEVVDPAGSAMKTAEEVMSRSVAALTPEGPPALKEWREAQRFTKKALFEIWTWAGKGENLAGIETWARQALQKLGATRDPEKVG